MRCSAPMAFAGAILAVAASPAIAGEKDHIAVIEREMLPAVRLAGAAERPESLSQEMTRLHVPGIGVAVIRRGKIAWVKGYGVTSAGGAPVTAETLFQAASISKPITAVAALRLVDAGQLALDTDVNDALTSWQLKGTDQGPITLRELLAHTAGTNAHGYSGYAAGKPVPTLRQVLDGAPPANSEAVVSETAPGKSVSYSGGGYEVVQQLMEDRTGLNFNDLMQKTVLIPAGMTHSRFEQPLAQRLSEVVAQPHDATGQRVPGGAFTYPELAAAGLWTTAEDLARFIIAVQKAASGVKGALLTPATARTMLTPGLGSRGLGFELQTGPTAKSLSHGGANEGFRNYLFAYLPNGDGAVVMTNATQGDKVGRDLVRSIAHEYGWPTNQTIVRTAVAYDPSTDDRLIGTYEISGFGNFQISKDGEHLSLSLRPGVTETLYRSAPGEFFILSQDARLLITINDGHISGRLIAPGFDLGFKCIG